MGVAGCVEGHAPSWLFCRRATHRRGLQAQRMFTTRNAKNAKELSAFEPRRARRARRQRSTVHAQSCVPQAPLAGQLRPSVLTTRRTCRTMRVCAAGRACTGKQGWPPAPAINPRQNAAQRMFTARNAKNAKEEEHTALRPAGALTRRVRGERSSHKPVCAWPFGLEPPCVPSRSFL